MSDLLLSGEVREGLGHTLHWIATAIEVLGVGVILLGIFFATIRMAYDVRAGDWGEAYRSYRANLGRGILLGLEFFIAADIIGMVAIVPTFERLGILAVIIMIRTLLSFSLQIEVEGRLPWRRNTDVRRTKETL